MQRGPKYPKNGKTCGPRQSTEQDQNAAHGTNRAATASGHHGPWWLPRPGRGGCPRPWWSVFARLRRFPFACLFVFRRFLLFSFFKLPCIWTPQKDPNSLHSYLYFHFHSFRLVFRERKGERRRLQGSWSGFGDRKTGARFG